MDQKHENNSIGAKVWLPLAFALVLIGGMFIGMQLQSAAPPMVVERGNLAGNSVGQGKIEELIRYIEAKYVDEVDRDKLIQEAIDEVLSKLDPHSTYFTAEELQEATEQLEGSFDGIGVEFMVVDDTIVIVSPLAGGPSEAVGILAGDKIISVEDSIIAGLELTNRDIVNFLRGERGSEVRIGVKRGNDSRIRHFNITRDKIPMNSVDIAYMLDEKTGYIKVNRFSATTYEEFMQGLEKLVEKEDMEDLVIDLRHNPGGYLQQATNILSQLFKDKDKLLVYTEGRAVSRNDYESSGRAFFDVDDIVVLIDEGSASASEILAGAVQDHDRGIIVGRRSFGKGLVQEQYRLRDGSALRLTVARYYTPSGRSIQKPYNDLDQYNQDVIARYESGELTEADKMSIQDSTKYYTADGHVVYGGGGLFPDVFVPIDTNLFSDTYLLLRQYIPEFTFGYVEDNNAQFSEYTLEKFVERYTVSNALFGEFMDYVRTKGLKEELPNLKNVRKELDLLIKARIARQLFGDEGFFTVLNSNDEMVRKALEILKEPDPLVLLKDEE
ncbi:S41 family peptidase [Flavilitoribacter nigricans]|uniref:Carboxyl-terminal protease n=1 Tax=Flavilitoribacter nigricans (strain ATCC 23147 / DSM 23189 / NBRC 102662 / NCIMB 1420 / SS-2) TaxID=1122177 RepID=A0A2D0NHQ2_FLAN2|nr:S41 family peptidase [Flavilitoribacter nigricans]PHN07948.1 carboxyl-terminal protease [Flavilitoribacter nigricans DSM 23189 = NBRC 102662]